MMSNSQHDRDRTSANGASKKVPVFVQLEALRSVIENWDGYGGAAMRPEAIDAAGAFLRSLAQFEVGWKLLPETLAFPTRTGGVLLLWEREPHSLEVEIEVDRPVTGAYLNTETDEGEDFSADLDRPDSSRFLELCALVAPAFQAAAG